MRHIPSFAVHTLGVVATLFGLGLPATATAQSSLSVVVELTRAPGPDVRLRVAVCSNMHTFEEEYGCVIVAANAQSPMTRVEFPDLKPGVYAIKCYVDDNGNSRLDTGWMGSPTEPHGFSNNASRLTGLPTFDMAKFVVTEGVNVHRITLR